MIKLFKTPDHWNGVRAPTSAIIALHQYCGLWHAGRRIIMERLFDGEENIY